MDNGETIAFEFIDGIAVLRMVGHYTLPAGIELIRTGIAQARDRRISRLMMVITENRLLWHPEPVDAAGDDA